MVAQAIPFDVEEFWESLLGHIEAKEVIPVVGAELLTVEDGGQHVQLYRAVAERLLIKNGLSAAALSGDEVLREHHELNDAVRALAAAGRNLRDQYGKVNTILKSLVDQQDQQDQPLPALRQLASIKDFDLFVTTTPDDLLAQALNSVRFDGADQTDQIEYAPKLPTERRRDIPEMPSSQYTAVFYMFGKANISPFFAIHDEDALEFPYTMQAGNGPERMFSQLRRRSLL